MAELKPCPLIGLEPCPFCNGKAKISVRQMEYYGQNYYGDKKIRYGAQAICCSCHARGPLSSMTAIGDGENFKSVRNALIRNAANDWNQIECVIRIEKPKPYKEEQDG